jgi:hypothetical protein
LKSIFDVDAMALWQKMYVASREEMRPTIVMSTMPISSSQVGNVPNNPRIINASGALGGKYDKKYVSG